MRVEFYGCLASKWKASLSLVNSNMAPIIRFNFFSFFVVYFVTLFLKDQGFQDSVVTGRLGNQKHGDIVERKDTSVKRINLIFVRTHSSYFLPLNFSLFPLPFLQFGLHAT